MEDDFAVSYEWIVLQEGKIGLSPSGSRNPFTKHQCTSVLLWPANEKPSAQNTIITDPCFTEKGYQEAIKSLSMFELSLKDIGQVFVSHDHWDHLLRFPDSEGTINIPLLRVPEATSGIKIVACPGHSSDQRGLVFRSAGGDQVWIVGDAIINKEWLLAWMYYWPNNYRFEEIIQTWNSMTSILSKANIVVPGHGKPIHITHELLSQLLPRLQQSAQAYMVSAQVIEGRQEILRTN